MGEGGQEKAARRRLVDDSLATPSRSLSDHKGIMRKSWVQGNYIGGNLTSGVGRALRISQ